MNGLFLWRSLKYCLTIGCLFLLGVATSALTHGKTPVVYQHEVVKAYSHDPLAFCQGLEFADGTLYEGTGKYGESSLRKVDLATGKVLQQVPLGKKFFGEGITLWKDRIFQLTWQSGVAFIYDRKSLKPLGTFSIRGEGWGLTHDRKHLILSDGTAKLQFLDPKTFRVVRRITVREGRTPVRHLNELEYVEGEIWANVWRHNFIARISPQSGRVVGWIDLRGLAPVGVRRDPDAVLNGIAYDAKQRRLFVTGKNWPTLFEIRLKRE